MNDLAEKAKQYAKALIDNPGHELRNMAQAASNSASENISIPIDLLANGLRKIGLSIPQDAMGGSYWMKQNGLTQEVEPGISKTIGETAGMLIPILTINKFKK